MNRSWLVALVWCLAMRASGAAPLHLMAFNVLFRGANDAASVKAIADEAPEVVCLTELTPTFVKAFEGSLAARYPHRALQPATGTWGGPGLDVCPCETCRCAR